MISDRPLSTGPLAVVVSLAVVGAVLDTLFGGLVVSGLAIVRAVLDTLFVSGLAIVRAVLDASGHGVHHEGARLRGYSESDSAPDDREDGDGSRRQGGLDSLAHFVPSFLFGDRIPPCHQR